MTECRTCKLLSLMMGKKLLMPLFGHRYKQTKLDDVQKYLEGLDLEIVGSLSSRGWTTNDIDVIGERQHIQELVSRLRKDAILVPVHYCGGRNEKHSHVKCAYFGVKMALTGKGY